jgi:O-antigen ligase
MVTIAGVGSPMRAAPGTSESAAATSSALFVLKVLAFATVFLQRLAVPGNTPLLLPLGYICVAYAYIHHVLVIDKVRVRWFLISIGACAIAALISTAVGGSKPSVNSMALLVAVYLPVLLVVTPSLRFLYRDWLLFLERCISVVAVLAIGSSLAQFVGWKFTDYLGYLPSGFLVQGYNTVDLAHYGSTYVKTNAFVCLEPSLCSQLVALGLLLSLMLRLSPWRTLMYAGAMVAALSGSGIILLVFTIPLLAMRRGPRYALAVLGALVVAAGLLVFTPPGQLLLGRSTELSNPDSSGSARFVQPYQSAYRSVTEGLTSAAVGHGPGSSTAPNEEVFNRSKRSPLETALTKLVREYGLPAMLLFLVFIWAFLIRSTPSPTLSVAAVLLYTVLSGALLSAGVIYLCYVLVGLFPMRDRRLRRQT